MRALEKADFHIVRQGKHIVMSNGSRIPTIPRNNPVKAYTMAGIVRELVSLLRTSVKAAHVEVLPAWALAAASHDFH